MKKLVKNHAKFVENCAIFVENHALFFAIFQVLGFAIFQVRTNHQNLDEALLQTEIHSNIANCRATIAAKNQHA